MHTTCSMQVKKSELADHFSKECRVRLQQCQFCDESVAYCEMKVLYAIDSDRPHTLKRSGCYSYTVA